jgi:hypothetical protein
MRRFSLVLIALIAVGCGGDDSGGPVFDACRIDMAPPIDGSEACVASADYGTIMPMGMEQTAGEDEIGPDGGTRTYYFWLGIIGNGTPNVSILEIDLWPGDGVFAGGLMTGNVPLAGEELDQMACGVCVYLLSDLTIDSMMRITDFNEVYFATGGAVNLTSVPMPPTADASPTAPDGSGGATGMIAGSLMSIQLGQLNLQNFDPIVGGCTSQVQGGNFGAMLARVPFGKMPKRGMPLSSQADIIQLVRPSAAPNP